MSEFHDNQEAQAITDAVQLAFWGQDFEYGAERLRTYAPDGQENDMYEVRMREKSAYDAWRRCQVLVQQVQCTLYDEGVFEQVDMIFAIWDDGLLTAVNTIDLYTEQRVAGPLDETEQEPEALDSDELIAYTKHALAQVTDLTA